MIDEDTWKRIATLEPDCLVLAAGGVSAFRSLERDAVRLCPPEIHVAVAIDADAQGEIAAVLFRARRGEDQAAVLGVIVSAGASGLRLAVRQAEFVDESGREALALTA